MIIIIIIIIRMKIVKKKNEFRTGFTPDSVLQILCIIVKQNTF